MSIFPERIYEPNPADMPAGEPERRALRDALHRLDASIELFKSAVLNRSPRFYDRYPDDEPIIGPQVVRMTRDLDTCNLPEDIETHIALVKQLYEALEAAAGLYGSKDRRGFEQNIIYHPAGDPKGTNIGIHKGSYIDVNDVFIHNGVEMIAKRVIVNDDRNIRTIHCY